MPQGKNQAAAQGAKAGAAKGGKTGQLAGAAIGSVIPGVGTAVGSKVGKLVGSGIGAAVGGNRAKKQQEENDRKNNIALEDPEQRRDLEMGRQRLKALQSGSSSSVQGEISDIENQQKAGLNAFAKVGGAGSLAGMLKFGKQAGQATNDAQERGKRESMFQQNMVRQLGDNMSQRKLELGLLSAAKSDQETLDAQNSNNLNANAAEATTGPGDVGKDVKGGMQGIKKLLGGSGAPKQDGDTSSVDAMDSQIGEEGPEIDTLAGEAGGI